MVVPYDCNSDRVFTVNRAKDTYSERVSESGVNDTTTGTIDAIDLSAAQEPDVNGASQGTTDIYAHTEKYPDDPADTIFWYSFGQGLINRTTVTSAYFSRWFNEEW